MNARKLTLCGIWMAALLLLTASGAAAEGGFFTDFTGTSVNCEPVGMEAPPVVHDGKLHVRGLTQECTDSASDPRVAGTERIVIHGILDLNDNLSGPFWGTSVVTSGEGQWLAVWTGESTSDGFFYARMHARGTGAYEGMQAWWWLERLSPDPAAPTTFHGRILDPKP